MVNNSSLNVIFSALSDPTRRAILERLAGGEASVTELAEPFAMSLPAISKHLHILENAGLIIRQKEGRVHHLRIAADSMKEALEWLSRYRSFWNEQFDSLSRFLETEEESDDRPKF
jgi:DNA-binding transcriptional ArsR family regulator